mmetsp:Transcript_20719/g.43629  ORF Transcript_20719/g.43629 Transcript_20719/m.43629 type:complete len:609 (+) Transcript_20719:31-1857(+)|eukprot:CAMPEP_0183763502 /NCGR_PEP_ID=MMETSP0739-20130205/9735_1 /TAXON_ID=385413 /ORGANISM="Thalassiosira miniscula, Strain CCMP1093" /LENGTH=608 /DNA_ID=CAMNT_0026001929 /DNA_START=23 /DNA_END=1849 /DNA_ORIENTATION=-
MAKGYKLTSAAGDGPKTCAFYFSDKGCRTGASCKFSHEKPADDAAARKSSSPTSVSSSSSSSVVSSESESDGEIIENRAGAYASLARTSEAVSRQNDDSVSANPFLTAVSSVPPPAAKEPQTQSQEQPTSEKKKKKRKKRKSNENGEVAPGDNIFDLAKTETSPPDKNQSIGTTLAAVAALVAAPPNKKSKQSVASPPNNQKQRPTKNTAQQTPSFRNLQLPIASFSIPANATAAATSPAKSPPKRSTSPQHDPAPPPPLLPLPTATAAHSKWKAAVIATREHANYANAFNFERTQQAESSAGISSPSDWITCRPYGKWCASNPAAIAIDCEMCETKDPVSGKVDNKALCRISVVNADNPTEVLLDTLVKPQWPVSDYRTWVNGISEKDLENVQFTLSHAQTFMAALCSEQTVVVGHAVHNDLLALRMVHHCVADTAMLFTHVDPNDGTPSLKNLAHGVLKQEMPDVHDSVNDARTALECARHYVAKGGKVDPVEKVYSRSSSRVRNNGDPADTAMLLVHRLPKTTISEHISEMFLAYTYVKPKHVPDVIFSGTHGKCHVEFLTREHAELAYTSLVGEEREDKTGKKQKRVGLKGGGYVCVRKMKKGK